MHWSISKRILAGYGVALLLLLTLFVWIYSDVNWIVKTFQERAESRDKIETAAQLQIAIRDAETGQRGYVITGRPEYLEPFNSAKTQAPALLDKLARETAATPEQAAQIPNLRRFVDAKFAEMAETLPARDQSFEAAAAIVNQDRGKQTMDDIHKILSAIDQREHDLARTIGDQLDQRFASLLTFMEIGTTVAAVLMLLLGWWVARSISAPLAIITRGAERIADGNLSEKTTPLDRQDEVGMLSRSFARMNESLQQAANANARIASGDLTVTVEPRSKDDDLGKAQAEMVLQLSSLISQVQQSGVQVNSSAVEIAAVAKQQQATANEVASTTTEISSTAKEMSATSTELLKTADQVSLVATETAGLATQGRASLNRMEATIQQISDASSTVTNRLGVMNEKAGNINAVVTTIAKVADQTNLLSLNAAIEAEKAGEYGKGFSVVATEIRRLADQTAASSGDIERIVKELISAVSAGVMGMDKFAEEVRRGAGEIGDTRRQLDEVIVQVQSLAPNVEALHEGMRAQTQGAEQISDALSQLGEAARQTADSIRDSSRAVDQLNEASHGLQGSISRFKIRA